MGDSPSVGYLLHGAPDDPSQPGWGGRFVRVWDGQARRLRPPHDRDGPRRSLRCGRTGDSGSRRHDSRPHGTDGRRRSDSGSGRQRRSNAAIPLLSARREGLAVCDSEQLCRARGSRRAASPPCRHLLERTSRAATTHPHWWIDDPDPAAAEGVHPGAKSVNRWREDFLRDFAARMARCSARGGVTAHRPAQAR